MSIIGHIFANPVQLPQTVRFLYSVKQPKVGESNILFLEKLIQHFNLERNSDRRLELFLTGTEVNPSLIGSYKRAVGAEIDVHCNRLSLVNILCVARVNRLSVANLR